MDQQRTNRQAPMVDDVKPPASSTPQVPESVAASIQEPSAQDLSSAPIGDIKQPPADADAPTEASQEQTEQTETGAPSNQQANTKDTSKKPLIMVIAAILVGIGLAGLSVYAYIATNKTDEPMTSETSESSATETASSIDEMTTEIDKALQGLDPESDFAASDLSDETLEL